MIAHSKTLSSSIIIALENAWKYLLQKVKGIGYLTLCKFRRRCNKLCESQFRSALQTRGSYIPRDGLVSLMNIDELKLGQLLLLMFLDFPLFLGAVILHDPALAQKVQVLIIEVEVARGKHEFFRLVQKFRQLLMLI